MFEILLAISVAFFCLCQYLKRIRRAVPLPPGPPGDPILGHARIFPRNNPHMTFMEWGKQYGESLNTPPTQLISLPFASMIHN